MAKKALPCPTVLRQLLRYEPETGKIFWRERTPEMFQDWGRGSRMDRPLEWRCARWNKRYAGAEAGALDVQSGYVRIYLKDRHFYAHRIAMAIETGPIPDGMQVDHQNGDRSDNRVSNLRLASVLENSRNTRLRENTSGVTGVFWNTQKGSWVAVIQVDGRRLHLGTFTDLGEAKAARKLASKEYGFHKNHGSTSRPKYIKG